MLSHDEFQKICKLAKLQVEDSEAFLTKLNDIFDWIRQLQDIDTSEVELSVSEGGRVERQDVVERTDSYTRNDILSNTVCKKFDMFAVPKVVE